MGYKSKESFIYNTTSLITHFKEGSQLHQEIVPYTRCWDRFMITAQHL